MDTARILVLANRTVDSEELRRALVERRASGPIAVTLLVPAAWEVEDPHGGVQSARRRMARALEALRAEGVEAEAQVGDSDPLVALERAWDPERFDEVVVSTLPQRLSRWLARDLPRRAERVVGRPVTHVVASERHGAPA